MLKSAPLYINKIMFAIQAVSVLKEDRNQTRDLH